MSWLTVLGCDPRDWLLDGCGPAVRAATLRDLLDRPAEDLDLVAARRAATRSDPVRAILHAQDADGWWAKPGPGYAPRYRSTVWQLALLDQLAADPDDKRVVAACRYVLEHTASASGGFGSSGVRDGPPPPPERVIHCLNGNLTAALLSFGHGDDPVLRAALRWAAATITANPARSAAGATSGPGFRCAANAGLPCAWGAIAEMRALSRTTTPRDPDVQAAIDAGVGLLLGHDPLAADYPHKPQDAGPSAQWWRPGFLSFYVADLLDLLGVLADLGVADDPRAVGAVGWLLGQQSAPGRWPNRRRYPGRTTVDLDPHPEQSPWVALRACRVLRAAHGP